MNTSCPLELASRKNESPALVPDDSNATLPVIVLNSYALTLPFCASGTNASLLLKKTNVPSEDIARFRCGRPSAPPNDPAPTTDALTVALAPLGLQDVHCHVFSSALYTYSS